MKISLFSNVIRALVDEENYVNKAKTILYGSVSILVD